MALPRAAAAVPRAAAAANRSGDAAAVVALPESAGVGRSARASRSVWPTHEVSTQERRPARDPPCAGRPGDGHAAHGLTLPSAARPFHQRRAGPLACGGAPLRAGGRRRRAGVAAACWAPLPCTSGRDLQLRLVG